MGMGEGILLMQARANLFLLAWLSLGISLSFRVNFAEIFCLKVYEFLSAIRESQFN